MAFQFLIDILLSFSYTICIMARKRKKRAQTRIPRKKTFNEIANKNQNVLSTHKMAIGGLIAGQNPKHSKVKTRPFIIWATLFDEDMKVQGAEVLSITTQKRSLSSRFPSDLILTTTDPFRAHKNTKVAITASSNEYLKNQRPFILKTLPPITQASGLQQIQILPDLILRRAYALLYNYHMISKHSQFQIQSKSITSRYGIILKTIQTSEIASEQEDFIALDVADAPVENYPFTIPGYLEQDDIDRISLIARHYAHHQTKNNLPIRWPLMGTYPNWPKEFLAFESSHPSIPKHHSNCTLHTDERTLEI